MARPKRFELLTPRFVVWCFLWKASPPNTAQPLSDGAERPVQQKHALEMGDAGGTTDSSVAPTLRQ
jgi:hypothetical protein